MPRPLPPDVAGTGGHGSDPGSKAGAAHQEVGNRPPARRHVVLVGLMGAGKTTIGREVASLLSRSLVDNDDQVLEMTGRTVADISEGPGGVAEMRRLESDALEEALASPVPAVITAAAGVVVDASARRRLRGAFVVWLRADPATLAARVDRASTRPLLGDDPLAVLQEMDHRRRHLYAEVADLVVDVDRLPPARVAERIADRVRMECSSPDLS